MSSKEMESRPEQRAEPKGGAIIADRYQIDRLIARGGMATVYLAHQLKLNRPVALKVLSPPADADDSGDFEERFRLEAETLASLDHTNIVILHDFGELEDGRFFLAMEYVEGPRLSDILREGPLRAERALSLIMQVAAALRYAHKRGVIHRDLKPSNLLIRSKDDGAEHVKVVDFGLVKLTETDQSITRAGLILGSPHCMAPEQVKGVEVDHRADVYAIGILLFRTLTGQYPFHGPNSAATMIAHLNQPVPSFFSVAPDLVVPNGLEEIVRHCLEKNPNDRYPNMQELMDDLSTCMDVPPENFRSVSQSNSRSITQSRVTTGSGTRAILLVAAILLAGIAVIGVAGLGIVYTQIDRFTGTTEGPPPEVPAGVEAIVTPVPEPAPVVAPAPAPEPQGTAEAVPAPVPVARPAPVAKPAPTVPAPQPEPKKEGDEKKAGEEKPPEGYMGLPDDLFEDP